MSRRRWVRRDQLVTTEPASLLLGMVTRARSSWRMRVVRTPTCSTVPVTSGVLMYSPMASGRSPTMVAKPNTLATVFCAARATARLLMPSPAIRPPMSYCHSLSTIRTASTITATWSIVRRKGRSCSSIRMPVSVARPRAERMISPMALYSAAKRATMISVRVRLLAKAGGSAHRMAEAAATATAQIRSCSGVRTASSRTLSVSAVVLRTRRRRRGSASRNRTRWASHNPMKTRITSPIRTTSSCRPVGSVSLGMAVHFCADRSRRNLDKRAGKTQLFAGSQAGVE